MKPQLVKDQAPPALDASQSLLTVADVAQRLSVSERTVRAWVSEPQRWEFPTEKLPTGSLRFVWAKIEAWRTRTDLPKRVSINEDEDSVQE